MIFLSSRSILSICRRLTSKFFTLPFFLLIRYMKGYSFCSTIDPLSLSIRLSKDSYTDIYSFFVDSIRDLCNVFHIEHGQKHPMFSIFLTSLISIKSIFHSVGHCYQILLLHTCYYNISGPYWNWWRKFMMVLVIYLQNITHIFCFQV